HEGASRCAYRSQTLFNGYSAWDLGDRPNKLLGDCQAAKASQAEMPKLPAPPPTAVVRQEPTPPVDPPPGLKPPPGVTPTPRPMPTPTVTAMTTPPASVPPAPTPTPTPAPAVPANKLRAQQLVAEAQRFHREGKLVEAKAKADEAMRLNVTFSAEETSPGLVYQ